MTSRRQFIVRGVGAFAGFLAVDSIFSRAAKAASGVYSAGSGGGRCLVVINLQGGNDGLNTVIPYSDPNYYRARPSIGVAQNEIVKLNADLGLNPQLADLKPLFDAQRLAILQGVHYPNPILSHFRSTEIWQTAAPDRYVTEGWAGRYLDEAHLPADNLFKGVAIGAVLPKMMEADKADVPAIADVRSFKFNGRRDEQRQADKILNGAADVYPFRSPYLSLVQSVEHDAHAASLQLPQLVAGYKPAVDFPKTPFGQGLNLISAIINAGLGTKVFYISLGSFDTHVYQRQRQDTLLAQFAGGIKAFYADLAAHHADDRVVTMTFSEFGRRVAENANRGTDHGTAAPMFVVGGGVKGGVYGDHPSLTDLDFGNLKWHTDFRSVYATVLERWLGVPSTPVLGGGFPNLSFV